MLEVRGLGTDTAWQCLVRFKGPHKTYTPFLLGFENVDTAGPV